jgi:hypothetical protein
MLQDSEFVQFSPKYHRFTEEQIRYSPRSKLKWVHLLACHCYASWVQRTGPSTTIFAWNLETYIDAIQDVNPDQTTRR